MATQPVLEPVGTTREGLGLEVVALYIILVETMGLLVVACCAAAPTACPSTIAYLTKHHRAPDRW